MMKDKLVTIKVTKEEKHLIESLLSAVIDNHHVSALKAEEVRAHRSEKFHMKKAHEINKFRNRLINKS